jgi:hypothetical protein
MMELEIPTERGHLLYEEYRIRWVRILGRFGFGAAFIGLALLYTFPPLGFWGDLDVDPVGGFMLIFLGAMFGIIGVMLAVSSFKDMPFKVYERGVTLPIVPLRDGLAGRETFVPSREISKVTYESTYVPKGGIVYYFRFHRFPGKDFNVSVKRPEEVTYWLFEALSCDVEGPE